MPFKQPAPSGLSVENVIPEISGDAEFDTAVSKVVPHMLRLHVLEPGEGQVGSVMEGVVKAIIERAARVHASKEGEPDVMREEKPGDDCAGDHELRDVFQIDHNSVLLIHEHVVVQVALENCGIVLAIGWSVRVEVSFRVQLVSVLFVLDERPN